MWIYFYIEDNFKKVDKVKNKLIESIVDLIRLWKVIR